jgi:serine/threonine-protein kinase SRPK3
MISGILYFLPILIAIFAEYLRLRLRERLYWALKVYVNTLKHNQELEVYRHLAGVTMGHSGREHIRRLEDLFKLQSRNGEHDVCVMTPLGMSLRTLQEMQENGIFQQTLVVVALDQVLTGLNFLHEADVIHTGKYLLSPSRRRENIT